MRSVLKFVEVKLVNFEMARGFGEVVFSVFKLSNYEQLSISL